MVQDQQTGASNELNPPNIRTVKLMGILSLSDWVWFFAGAIIVVLILVFGAGGLASGSFIDLIYRALIAAAILLPWAIFCFVQDKAKGKLRTRLWRFIRSSFKKSVLTSAEVKHIFDIKEVTQNTIHYKNNTDEGYATFFRINGFNPDLLQQSDKDAATQQLVKLFEAKFRFKIASTEISYKIDPKKYNSRSKFPGIYIAEQLYDTAMEDINSSVDLKERAYFVILESNSKQINEENGSFMAQQAAAAHIPMTPATDNEMTQLINKWWFNGYNPSNPMENGIKRLFVNNDMIQVTTGNGDHKYAAYRSYSALPVRATPFWLYDMFNNSDYDALVEFNDVPPQNTMKHIEEMDSAADGLIQTKWFKKKASDVERLRINKVKEEVQELQQELVNGVIGMKQVLFSMIFYEDTRKGLRKKIKDFKSHLNSFSTEWVFYDCKYQQFDMFLTSRLWDTPSLMYKKVKMSGASNIKSIAGTVTGISLNAGNATPNSLPVVHEIDHFLLSTALAVGCPFIIKTATPNDNSWYKGYDMTSSLPVPFFNDYWKINEFYNSFNRFYQGRNGSGKSATANLDMIQDRLDDRFIISIDPKPERVMLTHNLGGENVYIGVMDPNAPHINIFDVLVVPSSDDNGNNNSDPLSSQYQANLNSIAALTSLDVNNPNDKLLLSLFNDVQQVVYEKMHGFTSMTDFKNTPKDKFPIMKEFYQVIVEYAKQAADQTVKDGFQKLAILLKEHAVGISAHLFNKYSNIDWSKNRMWNFIVKDIALNYGNKNILATWVDNIVRLATAFMIANKGIVLYIDELHLIHNIPGVLQNLDAFARIDRSFKSSLCLINQNFNSIKSDADLKKKEYYQSIFTMSQYNMFFTTSDQDVDFLVQMLAGSGNPLSEEERRYMTQAGQGKCLQVMTAYDRYKVQFDITFWRRFWEEDIVSDLIPTYDAMKTDDAIHNLINPGTPSPTDVALLGDKPVPSPQQPLMPTPPSASEVLVQQHQQSKGFLPKGFGATTANQQQTPDTTANQVRPIRVSEQAPVNPSSSNIFSRFKK